MRRIAILLSILMPVSFPAFAQSTLLSAGPVASGHAPMYVTQGTSPAQVVVQDSGTAAGGGSGVGLRELNITARGTGTAPYAGQGTGPNGTVFTIFDAPTTNAAGYHYMAFSANAQGGGLISYGAAGAASALPLQFMVNGSLYQFPFTTTGVVGPASSAVNNAACWNNTSGTLLKDCGPFVTVGGNNTWTGTNNFTGIFQSNSVTQTFPASGAILGASDVQTVINKHIVASQIDSGTLPCVVMPALTGGVTNSAGSCATLIGVGVVANSNFAAASSANTVKGAATSTAVTDLVLPSCSAASNALQWLSGTGFQCGALSANTAGFGVSLSGGGVISISSSAPPYGYDMPVNMGLSASVAGGALTISLTTASGATPSAANPVLAPFRSTTLTTGTTVWGAVAGALSIVIPSAASLGTTNNVPFRVWVFMTYNAGTPQLGVALCSNGASVVYPCSSWETARKTATAISGFSTSAGTLYATAGVTNDAVRIIGYVEYSAGLAAAGSWTAAPTAVQVFGAGGKKPGDIIQTVYNSTSASATINGADQQTSLSVSVTPSSTINLIRITASFNTQITANTTSTSYRISRGLTPTYVGGVGTNNFNSTGATQQPITSVSLFALDLPSTVSTTTWYVLGTTGSGTSVFNSSTVAQTIIADEIMSALPEPANDNVNPGIYSLTG